MSWGKDPENRGPPKLEFGLEFRGGVFALTRPDGVLLLDLAFGGGFLASYPLNGTYSWHLCGFARPWRERGAPEAPAT